MSPEAVRGGRDVERGAAVSSAPSGPDGREEVYVCHTGDSLPITGKPTSRRCGTSEVIDHPRRYGARAEQREKSASNRSVDLGLSAHKSRCSEIGERGLDGALEEPHLAISLREAVRVRRVGDVEVRDVSGGL